MNISIIKENVSVEDICDVLGIEVKNQGHRKSILCPCHDDNHYGSCFITEKGFHCFACGENGDIFELVQAVNHCSFKEALAFIANEYGYSVNTSPNEQEKHRKILTKNEMELIGVVSKPVKAVIEIKYDNECSIEDRYDDWFPLDTGDEVAYKNVTNIFYSTKPPVLASDGYCVFMKTISRNPLQSLADENYEAYCSLIRNKTVEAIEGYKEDLKRFPFYRKILNEKIRKCENIVIELTPTTPSVTNEQKKTRRKNIFGSIKGVSI